MANWQTYQKLCHIYNHLKLTKDIQQMQSSVISNVVKIKDVSKHDHTALLHKRIAFFKNPAPLLQAVPPMNWVSTINISMVPRISTCVVCNPNSTVLWVARPPGHITRTSKNWADDYFAGC
jgi:hypothetical protein